MGVRGVPEGFMGCPKGCGGPGGANLGDLWGPRGVTGSQKEFWVIIIELFWRILKGSWGPKGAWADPGEFWGLSGQFWGPHVGLGVVFGGV